MRPLVESWRRGEGSQAVIAARHGMPTPTFAWWCQRLSRSRSSAERFVAVSVEAPVDEAPSAALEVVLARGRRVRVPVGFDAETLARLLSALERPC